jgi:FkbM family methyltransferase
MIIKYGLLDKNIDVTSICNSKLKYGKYIIIPAGDHSRASIFTDPISGILKNVYIVDQDNITHEYNDSKAIYIDTQLNKVMADNIPDSLRLLNVDEKIRDIHSKLKLKYGTFSDELPEQKMAVKYLTGNERVLEIGGNIGRNSLIISFILGINSTNLVVLESDTGISNQLRENMVLNKMNFHIENSALSKRKLIQKDWNTIVSDTVLNGWKSVNTITYTELTQKYNIAFDTLVLDCEGAFYYILQDMPEVLENIQLIIMENDYTNIQHKIYIDTQLKANGFYVEYSESGGWGPCYGNFFEVWKRINLSTPH